jgi:hypothetical protein
VLPQLYFTVSITNFVLPARYRDPDISRRNVTQSLKNWNFSLIEGSLAEIHGAKHKTPTKMKSSSYNPILL